MTKPAYKLDEQVGFLLRLASQAHTALFAEMAPLDLTPTQFAALARLAELGTCSQNELGRRTAMDVATIKGVVDRLRAKGLVTVTPDPGDRRRTMLAIPDEQKALAQTLHEAGTRITKATLAPLENAEQKELVRLLKKLAVPAHPET